MERRHSEQSTHHKVTADATYTAVFKAKQFNITIVTNDDTMGEVAGAGTYEYNKVATLLATPADGYHFVQCGDGSKENPHYVKVIKDKMYIAAFADGTAQEEKDS